MKIHVKFDMEKDFLTSYYRDEIKAKGIDADYKLSINDDNYEKEIQNIMLMKVQ